MMKLAEVLFPEVYDQNEKKLNDLRYNLAGNTSDWMLCLGAGVSISVGLPSWYQLIAKINAQLLPLEFSNSCQYKETDSEESNAYIKGIEKFREALEWDEKFVKKMADAFEGKNWKIFHDINVLEAAEYVRNFIEILSGTSDEKTETPCELDNEINSTINDFIQKACSLSINITDSDIKNKTLGAVGQLMKAENVPIFSAITYNYDNLLECYLREGCGCEESKVHSFTKADELKDFGNNDGWNIYHVHGRIPVKSFKGEEMSESVILTETDYYEEERMNYSWVNIIQSYAIARENLIFIGFSGTDYNFRRIIKYVNQDRMKEHDRYIFFAVDDIVKAIFSGEDDIEVAVKKMADGKGYSYEKLMINHLIYAQTLYWKKHGLTVIWTSISELPEKINSLHKM
ncbi:MAG TPA: SIR2 family protein [Candidatus Mediterraneibacter stercoripullorum]|nr:SIR2 family protein [Candidatus Mediterraneibacter stercoripullorum]